MTCVLTIPFSPAVKGRLDRRRLEKVRRHRNWVGITPLDSGETRPSPEIFALFPSSVVPRGPWGRFPQISPDHCPQGLAAQRGGCAREPRGFPHPKPPTPAIPGNASRHPRLSLRGCHVRRLRPVSAGIRALRARPRRARCPAVRAARRGFRGRTRPAACPIPFFAQKAPSPHSHGPRCACPQWGACPIGPRCEPVSRLRPRPDVTAVVPGAPWRRPRTTATGRGLHHDGVGALGIGGCVQRQSAAALRRSRPGAAWLIAHRCRRPRPLRAGATCPDDRRRRIP